MNKKQHETKYEHSQNSSPCGPLCAIFPRGVASFPIQHLKRGVRPLWAKLVKGLPSLAQQIPCSVRLRRTKEKQDKEVPSPATTLQTSNARSADVFQVHSFGVKFREKKCLRGQHSRKRRWLRDSDRCHGENPRFQDDKYRLRGTVRGSCPSRPLRQRARPTPL